MYLKDRELLNLDLQRAKVPIRVTPAFGGPLHVIQEEHGLVSFRQGENKKEVIINVTKHE